jgi:hypothetical protein
MRKRPTLDGIHRDRRSTSPLCAVRLFVHNRPSACWLLATSPVARATVGPSYVLTRSSADRTTSISMPNRHVRLTGNY